MIRTLTDAQGNETTVWEVRETPKAILVRGNCSEAWFPKSVINEDGAVKSTFPFSMSHCFLWEAPYDEEKRRAAGASVYSEELAA